jgi:hypothetical protein
MMDKDSSFAMPVATVSRTWASLSFAGAATFVVLLAALHFIKPEIDPSWHFISEYAIGDYGWVMVIAFLAFALSYASLFFALRAEIRTLGGRIGLALLLVSAAGLILAAVFTTDPVNTSQEAMTAEGRLHNLGGALGIAMPFAILLVSWSLSRNSSWSPTRRSLLWAAVFALLGFVVSFVSLGVMLSQSGGVLGPGVPVGWPNRLEVLAYSVWLMVVSWAANRK